MEITEAQNLLGEEKLEYVLRGHEGFKEEVGSVMGGRVLPLPSDRLREERAEGRAEGGDLKRQEAAQGETVELIADELEEDMEEIRLICDAAGMFAPNYDEEAVFCKLREIQGKNMVD